MTLFQRDVNFNVDFNLEMVLAELYEFAKSFKEEVNRRLVINVNVNKYTLFLELSLIL